jgi:hypothetical protein
MRANPGDDTGSYHLGTKTPRGSGRRCPACAWRSWRFNVGFGAKGKGESGNGKVRSSIISSLCLAVHFPPWQFADGNCRSRRPRPRRGLWFAFAPKRRRGAPWALVRRVLCRSPSRVLTGEEGTLERNPPRERTSAWLGLTLRVPPPVIPACAQDVALVVPANTEAANPF